VSTSDEGVTCGRLTRRVKAVANSLEAELAKSWEEEDGEGA
jgi:hypothetical protein